MNPDMSEPPAQDEVHVRKGVLVKVADTSCDVFSEACD